MSLKAYYLRVFALLAAVALGVTLVCGALALGLNSIREQAWLERAPEPLMEWLSEHPEAVRAVAAMDGPTRVRGLPIEQARLDDVARERLGYGQVLADRRGDAIYFYRKPHEGALLELRLQNVYRDLNEITARLLVLEMERLGLDEERDEHLLALGSSLGVYARPVTQADELPDQRVLNQVTDDGFAYYQPFDREAARMFARQSDGQLIELQFQPPFNRWSWHVILLIGLTVAAGLGVTVYFMLSRLHQRLRNIENAVARIARGELDARVSGGEEFSIAGRLGDSFNRMADHIERLVMVQREMIHGVSHELRTPVARIRFGVQMIEDCDDPDMLDSQLAGIDRDIEELNQLIDEILTYARLEQGGPVFSVENTNVRDVVDQVVEEQQSTKPELQIQARFEPPSDDYPEADTNPLYIHRAIQNLVGNATRYASKRVQVVCLFDGETCRVDVHDDGPGVPEDEWEKVFTAFARLDESRDRSSGGYGLGLSIVRRILNWHGGQAFVGRSDELGGACFSLVWPRRQPEQGEVQS